MIRLPSILYICLFILSQQATAQIIPFKKYTVYDKLPSNYISDIVQDHKGYIWLATDNGLAKFDGYDFKNYTIGNGLSDNYIRSLTVDESSRIWAGTESGGISIISENNISLIDESVGLINGAIINLFSDKLSNIWAISENQGFSIIKKDTIITFGEESYFQSTIISHLTDSRNIVWLGTEYNGVFLFRNDTLEQLNHKLLNNNSISDITEDSYGRIWFATQEEGVICYDMDTVIVYNTDRGLPTNTTLSIIERSEGEILVGTHYGGIARIRNSNIEKDLTDDTEDYSIWQLYKDSKNNIWAKTYENGALRIDEYKVENYSVENNLASAYVNKIYQDHNENIWIITENGISKYGHAFFEIYNKGFLENETNITTLLIDSKGSKYTGTLSGLSVQDIQGNMYLYSTEQGLPIEPNVSSIAAEDDNIWLGTTSVISVLKNNKIYEVINSGLEENLLQVYYSDIKLLNDNLYAASSHGLLIYNKKTGVKKRITTEDGLISNDLYSIGIDNSKRVWCGTSDGLSVYNGSDCYNFTEFEGLPNNFCNDIHFDEKGVAWIATDYGVCSATLSDDFILSTRNYGTEDGLRSNSIISITSDNTGNIWLGHNEGVDRLNPKTKVIRNYGIGEGFLPVECNLGAIQCDLDNNIWFGTIDGLVKYKSESDIPKSHPPKVYINNINLYNDTSSIENYFIEWDSISLLPKNLRLPYNKNNIYFNYVGLHYTIVEKNKYKYRLLGHIDEWSEPTHDILSIPYTKLPHGKYTFQVMAANCDGVWTEVPAEFSFEISPPWWKSWWFRIIEIIIGILLLYLFIFFRERKLRYDKKILQLKVKERTLEIEKQKDQIEEQHDRIAKQKKEITDSIEYAQHIQSAVLPKDETISPLLKDYFILYKPRDIVSGDFYWIHGDEDKVIAIAADCTGHGVPGAFMSMLGVSILNEIATKNTNLQAHEILNTLRTHIINTLAHTRHDEEARDGMDLALSIIDFNKKKVQYAGAYNPLIIIRDGFAEVYKANKMPVGLHSGEMKDFSAIEIELKPDDCLYMFSDGYADQFGGPEGKKFKSGAFRKLLIEISSKPMKEQKEIIDKTIMDWMRDYEQIDDILVMGIRIS
jgi:ligand-binding sensor domain-containing protein/serine phosphatase RsbU (regulator of sigma subunit)